MAGSSLPSKKASLTSSLFGGAVLPIFLVFAGCMSNHVFLEALVRADPGIGPLVTLTYFVVPAVLGFAQHVWDSLSGRPGTGWLAFSAPLGAHIGMATLYFTLSVLNNYAFSFHIPMPLHTIFRSASLVTNLALGYLFLGRKVPARRVVAVCLVTIGITAVSFASSPAPPPASAEVTEASLARRSTELAMGIAILVLTAFVSSSLGIVQEWISGKYGKNPRENLFLSHALALPLFAIASGNIAEHVSLALASEKLDLAAALAPWLSNATPSAIATHTSMPRTVALLIATNATQYVCIRSVFTVVARTSALTLTLVITLRKFLSVVVSVVVFGNPFTPLHMLGTSVVFVGTMLYSFSSQTPEGKGNEKKKAE